MPAMKLSKVLSDLPRRLATDFAVAATLHELAADIVEVLPVDGATVTLFPPNAVVCRAGDVTGERSAPLLSLPLRHGGAQLGAIALYRADDAALDDATVASARTFAEVAVAYLLVARARAQPDPSSEQTRVTSLAGVASAVAHDFNNLLTVTLNYASLIAATEANDQDTRCHAARIVSASERAALLTGQLKTAARAALDKDAAPAARAAV